MKKLLLLFALTVALPIAALAQGNTWQEATILNSGTTASGTMSSKDADDWYKIELPKDGNVTFGVSTDGDLLVRYVQLYYLSDEGSIKEGEYGYVYKDDGVRSFTCNALLSNPYYVRVHREKGEGNYFMKYTYTPNRYGNDTEPNNEWKTAQKIEMGQTVQGHLGFWKMEKNGLYGWKILDGDDYYKIEVPTEGSITLDLKCEETLDVSLLEVKFPEPSNGTLLLRTNMNPSKVQGPLVSEDVLPGTYYVLVHRNSDTGSYGGYTLKYTHEPYNCDPEPNDDYEHAIEIKDGETIRGHFGSMLGQPNTSGNYREGEDWYKVTVTDGSQALLSIVPEEAKVMPRYAYNLYVMENGELKSIKNGVPGGQSFTLQTPEGQNGTYYLELNGHYNPGYYTLTRGALRRSAGSKIRINTTGRGLVRLGVPTPISVKVENISVDSTGSFFVSLPVTPDMEILYADVPTEEGTVRYLHDDFAINDPDEGDCAVFIIPDLGPHATYSFTIYAQGRVSNNTRSSSPMKESWLGKKAVALMAALRSDAERFKEEFEWEDVIDDGVTVAVIRAGINTKVFPKENRDDYAKIVGLTPNTYKVGAKPKAVPIVHYTTKVCERIAEASFPGMATFNALKASGQIANDMVNSFRRKLWLWIWKDLGYIPDPDVMDGKMAANQVVRSLDPNEMVGPIGVGDENYIGETRTIDYRILFENKKEATAPAYRIRISDVLDENVFDVSSVRFGETSHEGVGYDWKITREGNRLSWDIEGIELPPNVNAPEGEGYVSFSVGLKPGLKSGTQLKNKAAIIFDYNETIETNEYMNTLDLVAPIAEMKEATVEGNTATVTCTATDEGAGVSHYLFYASLNGGEARYLGQNTEPTFSFDAGKNADYTVYALAVDHVGNTQTAAPATLTFNPTGIHGITYAPAATNGWAVYRLNGTTAATGQGVPNVQLPAGIYIIREGGKSRKVVVK